MSENITTFINSARDNIGGIFRNLLIIDALKLQFAEFQEVDLIVQNPLLVNFSGWNQIEAIRETVNCVESKEIDNGAEMHSLNLSGEIAGGDSENVKKLLKLHHIHCIYTDMNGQVKIAGRKGNPAVITFSNSSGRANRDLNNISFLISVRDTLPCALFAG